MKNLISALSLLFLLLGISSCYYDKQSEIYPQAQCDTTAVKWSTTIQPIMQQQCAYAGCHAGADARAGIDLTTYNGVKAIAVDGSLVGSIEHQSNYSAMPRNNSKLPDCQISQIRIWVAAGAQNN